jgi:hypothetical protein
MRSIDAEGSGRAPAVLQSADGTLKTPVVLGDMIYTKTSTSFDTFTKAVVSGQM